MKRKASGHVVKHGSKWYVRFYTGKKITNSKGAESYERKCVFVVDYSDQYRTPSSVENHPDFQKILRPVSDPTPEAGASGSLSFAQFIEDVYLPYVEASKRPSTSKGYKNLFHGVIKSHLNGTPLTQFGIPAAQKVINAIKAEKNPATRTLIHVKAFMAAAIWHGLRNGFFGDNYTGGNPLAGESLDLSGRRSEPTHAYTSSEVEAMLKVLKNDTYKTLVIVAAYTGLRASELRGLRWSDLDFKNESLSVNQSFSFGQAQETKTETSRGTIPMIRPVIDALQAHRKRNPMTSYVFEGMHLMPLDIESIGSKKIKKLLVDAGQEWYGWHAFRRGLGTTLRAKNVKLETITSILRHADSQVTERLYAKPSAEVNAAAMKKVGRKSEASR